MEITIHLEPNIDLALTFESYSMLNVPSTHDLE